MKLITQLVFVFLLFKSIQLSSLHDDYQKTILYVKNRLLKSKIDRRMLTTKSNVLVNSNKIGIGFDPYKGSPSCYNGACQMKGFGLPVFDLSHNSLAIGSCSDKLIPNGVHLNCLPSISTIIDFSATDTVEQYYNSVTKKVEFSSGIKLKGVEFSYKHSTETSRIIDTIVKNHESFLMTQIEISLMELTAFDLKMNLSSDFKFVIDLLPCCDENDLDIQEYILSNIFDFFGYTYISNMLLGGITQQQITMSRTSKDNLISQGVSISNEAKVSFDAGLYGGELGYGATDAQQTQNQNKFQNEVKTSDTFTFGGDTQLTTFAEWSKTVKDNPIITKFSLREISRVLNSLYFPYDPLIKNKSALIAKTLEKYLDGSIYCYGNCGNSTQGSCKPTGSFQFGVCQCNAGWTGSNCETSIGPKILHGTICGFDRSIMRVDCYGHRPWHGCPNGWAQYNWWTDLTVCYKVNTTFGKPVYGTLCGLRTYQAGAYPFDYNFGCNNSSMLNKICPTGYNYVENSGVGSGDQAKYSIRLNGMCVLIDAQEHSSGTLCGLQIQSSLTGPSCDGYNPGLNECPPGYSTSYTAFNDFGFMTCVKK